MCDGILVKNCLNVYWFVLSQYLRLVICTYVCMYVCRAKRPTYQINASPFLQLCVIEQMHNWKFCLSTVHNNVTMSQFIRYSIYTYILIEFERKLFTFSNNASMVVTFVIWHKKFLTRSKKSQIFMKKFEYHTLI